MSLARDGYQLLEQSVAPELIAFIQEELEHTYCAASQAGIRNADKKFHSIQQLVHSPQLVAQASALLGDTASLVRVSLFNKTSDHNWLVTWHQDKTVSVSATFELEGWSCRSIKDGRHHVQPPLDVLNQMITFRIHIDDSTLNNGCLRLIPGSHTHGILTQEQIQEMILQRAAVNCVATAGTVLAMKPHILHASSKATLPGERRIVHAEYCKYALPSGIQWA